MKTTERVIWDVIERWLVDIGQQRMAGTVDHYALAKRIEARLEEPETDGVTASQLAEHNWQKGVAHGRAGAAAYLRRVASKLHLDDGNVLSMAAIAIERGETDERGGGT